MIQYYILRLFQDMLLTQGNLECVYYIHLKVSCAVIDNCIDMTWDHVSDILNSHGPYQQEFMSQPLRPRAGAPGTSNVCPRTRAPDGTSSVRLRTVLQLLAPVSPPAHSLAQHCCCAPARPPALPLPRVAGETWVGLPAAGLPHGEGLRRREADSFAAARRAAARHAPGGPATARWVARQAAAGWLAAVRNAAGGPATARRVAARHAA